MVGIEIEARICPLENLSRYIVARRDEKYHFPCYCHKFSDEVNPLDVFEKVCLSSFGRDYGLCLYSEASSLWEVNRGKYLPELNVNSEHARRTRFVEVDDEEQFVKELDEAVRRAEEELLQKAQPHNYAPQPIIA